MRIRQAVELRSAARNSTLRTAPLSLYYSVLNLTRAALGIRDDVLHSKSHGLRFKSNEHVMECGAGVKRSGTFPELLKCLGASRAEGTAFTLEDCLVRTIEVSAEYFTVTRKPSLVCPVHVRAHKGKVSFTFNPDVAGTGFTSHWREDFPSVAMWCEPETEESNGFILRSKAGIKIEDYDDVAALCEKMLEVDLLPRRDNALWFAVRAKNTDLVLPRAAYYFAGVFILGNIVRYEPEIIFRLTTAHSKWTWLIHRFLNSTERFYPNLMMNYIHQRNYFFGSA